MYGDKATYKATRSSRKGVPRNEKDVDTVARKKWAQG